MSRSRALSAFLALLLFGSIALNVSALRALRQERTAQGHCALELAWTARQLCTLLPEACEAHTPAPARPIRPGPRTSHDPVK